MPNPFFPSLVDPTAAHIAILGLVAQQSKLGGFLDVIVGQHRKHSKLAYRMMVGDRRLCEIAQAMNGLDPKMMRLAQYLLQPSFHKDPHNG
jgi:hypothetical protein